MLRNIIKIDKEKCDGCGLCAEACHEGAILLQDGKAVLLRDDYCDGLGDCLPTCPTGAISFEKREAAAYDDAAVKRHLEKTRASVSLPCGCPGTQSKTLREKTQAPATPDATQTTSHLRQWPVQMQLVPVNAPYFENARLLIAADCCAYAHGDFHRMFMQNTVTLIGCPKLDNCDYAEKLAAILFASRIQSIAVARMEVPCCGGIEAAARAALARSGKAIPLQITTIATDGTILK